MITVDQIAQEIIDDMGLTDVTMAQVSTWIRANLGRINNLTALSLTLDEDLEITPEIGDSVKDIIKCAYAARYFSNLAKTSMTSAASSVLSVKDDVSAVTFVNANEVAKVYRQIAKDEEANLKELSKMFKYNESSPRTYVAPSITQTIAPPHYAVGDTYLT